MQQGKRMTTATLNVYNPIHLSEAVVGRGVAKLSAGHASIKQLNCSLLFAFTPISTRSVQATSMFRELRTRPRIARRYRSWALTIIENL